MTEPSTPPIYPGDEPETIGDDAARQFVQYGLTLGLEIFASCNTPRKLALTHTALAAIGNPGMNISAAARRLGVHRKTLHAHIRRLRRAFRKLLKPRLHFCEALGEKTVTPHGSDPHR